MQITTSQILKILLVLSWIIFVGICIEAGGFMTNAISSLILTPDNMQRLWHEVDLSVLYKHDPGYFFIETLLMGIVAILRACIFYLIIKILHEKKLNLSQPFNKETGRFILNISYLALLTGLFSWCGVECSEWFIEQGVKMPDAEYLRLGGADVWLFMGVTLFVIAQIFKRGIEIQKENELTV